MYFRSFEVRSLIPFFILCNSCSWIIRRERWSSNLTTSLPKCVIKILPVRLSHLSFSRETNRIQFRWNKLVVVMNWKTRCFECFKIKWNKFLGKFRQKIKLNWWSASIFHGPGSWRKLVPILFCKNWGEGFAFRRRRWKFLNSAYVVLFGWWSMFVFVLVGSTKVCQFGGFLLVGLVHQYAYLRTTFAVGKYY